MLLLLAMLKCLVLYVVVFERCMFMQLGIVFICGSLSVEYSKLWGRSFHKRQSYHKICKIYAPWNYYICVIHLVLSLLPCCSITSIADMCIQFVNWSFGLREQIIKLLVFSSNIMYSFFAVLPYPMPILMQLERLMWYQTQGILRNCWRCPTG